MDDNDDDDGGGGGRPCNRHRADRTEEGNDTVSRVGGLRHIYRKLHRHHHRSHRRFSETRSIDPSVRLLSSGHQASNFHFPNVTPPLPSLKGSLSKMRTNLRRSRRLIRTAFVYMLCMYMCVYVCVYIYIEAYYVYGLSNRGVEIYRYLERTSGGHSRSLASLGHGHFVAGPRFPSPIPLLIFAAIAPPHPSLPPSFSPPFVLQSCTHVHPFSSFPSFD